MRGGAPLPHARLPLPALPSSSPPILEPAWLAVLMFMGAAVTWYIAVTAAAAVFRNSAWALVVAGGLPAIAGALWFAGIARPGAALSLVLATALAACTLVAGIVASSEPGDGRRTLDDPGRRLNATLLPAAAILVVAGFGGELNLLHALLLVLAGSMVSWLCLAMRREVPTANIVDTGSGGPGPQPAPAQNPPWAMPLQLALAALLAVVGAGLAVGSVAVANRHKGMELELEYAILISGILALPLIGVGMRFGNAGQAAVAQRGLTLLAVAMICLAVPLVVACDVTRQVVVAIRADVPLRALLSDLPAVDMPMRLWRVDSIMLCLGGLLLLPPAAGRWRMGKLEALALILIYVLYLFMALVIRR